jgi:hypothetical protein
MPDSIHGESSRRHKIVGQRPATCGYVGCPETCGSGRAMTYDLLRLTVE